MFLVTRFLAKEAQMIRNFLDYFENPHSYVITALSAYWATLEIIWLLFTSRSGHTGLNPILSSFLRLNLCLKSCL